MDNIVCQECGEIFNDRKSLHSHIRKHKLCLQDYYHKHFPRYDLFTGEFIDFRDYEQYFSSFFNDKDNLGKFIENSPSIEQQKFIKEFLLARKTAKLNNIAPCQVDLRTGTACPSIGHFRKAFNRKDYYNYCASLGFESRFQDINELKFNYNLLNDLSITIDTREQKPLQFKDSYPIKNEKLDYGDYLLSNGAGYDVYFERKSLSDLISTVTLQEERFRNELDRAKNDGKYIVVVVESAIKDLLNFQNLKWVYSKHKISSKFVCHNIRTLIKDYDNLQFVFTGQRSMSVQTMIKIYCTAGKYKNIDLQLMFDLGVFY